MMSYHWVLQRFGRPLCHRHPRVRRAVRRWQVVALAAVAVFASGEAGKAAPLYYGNFSGTTVNYENVSEDSNSGDALPLFGAPSISGDSLDFNPVGFSATASGAAGHDITDGNLQFLVVAKPGNVIKTLNLAEAGDTTLAGFGTDSTYSSVRGTGVLNVYEVDGVGISTLSVPFSLAFTPSSGSYALISDFGGGPGGTIAWFGSISLNINGYLTAANVPFANGATKISVNLDNTLTALSEAGTFVLMAKKDFGGLSVTINVPEPTTGVLASWLGVCGAASKRRRRNC